VFGNEPLYSDNDRVRDAGQDLNRTRPPEKIRRAVRQFCGYREQCPADRLSHEAAGHARGIAGNEPQKNAGDVRVFVSAASENNDVIVVPILIIAGLVAAMILAMELGYRLGRRYRISGPERAPGAAALEASVFGLMGLLLAFTFNGAATRFEARRG